MISLKLVIIYLICIESVHYDPLTSEIIAGKEVMISIDKGRTGLGLGILGGADTSFVSV